MCLNMFRLRSRGDLWCTGALQMDPVSGNPQKSGRLLYVLFSKRKNARVIEFIFLTSFFFITPIEEFNALTGLILGYAYTILIRKQIIE